MFDNLKMYIDDKLYWAKAAECPEDLESANQELWEKRQIEIIDNLQAAMNVLNGKCAAVDAKQFEVGMETIGAYYRQMIAEITLGVRDELGKIEQAFYEQTGNKVSNDLDIV